MCVENAVREWLAKGRALFSPNEMGILSDDMRR
jgi:hypothetical protein